MMLCTVHTSVTADSAVNEMIDVWYNVVVVALKFYIPMYTAGLLPPLPKEGNTHLPPPTTTT